MPIVCIKAKHTEAKRHGEEKLSTLQQSLKIIMLNVQNPISQINMRNAVKKSWNLANVKKPISRAIQYQGTFSDNLFANAEAVLIPYTQF